MSGNSSGYFSALFSTLALWKGPEFQGWNLLPSASSTTRAGPVQEPLTLALWWSALARRTPTLGTSAAALESYRNESTAK